MYTYKLTIAYDGTDYAGWQVQKNALSIQEQIQNVLSTILRVPTKIYGAGRTDSGVHALGQCAHFVHHTTLPCKKILLSLNGLLPSSIRIVDMVEVPSDFHARFSALRKVYHYHLHCQNPPDLFQARYAYVLPFTINIPLLVQAAQVFVGTHDFSSFTNRGGNNKSFVRTIYRIDVVPEPGGFRLEYEGNGFLYQMVRNITGVLLDVCRGKMNLSDIAVLFAARDRRKVGMAAPPHALFLCEIMYQKIDAKDSTCCTWG